MQTDALIQELSQSPGLPFAITALQAVLDAERPLRQKFYDEITEDGKIEFINGKVTVQSPAKLKHIQITGRLHKLLETYTSLHHLGLVTQEKALICLTRNDYEPDICFFGPGKARLLNPDQLKFPAPDWVCEVLSESTEHIDRGIKLEDYSLHGVQEYWIIQPETEHVEIYLQGDKALQLASTITSGMLQSRLVPGFKIPLHALYDAQAANEVLKQMLHA